MVHFWAIVSKDPYCRTSLLSVHPWMWMWMKNLYSANSRRSNRRRWRDRQKHTIHILTLTLTLTLNLNLTLQLNVTIISSYLTNKHQYNMSANWMTSRLRDQSAARCKKCRPIPIGYTDNSLECANSSVCAILTITLTHEFVIIISD